MSPHRSSAAALAALLALSVLLWAATAAGTDDQHKPIPIVARVSKDAATSLYTIAIKAGGARLLLDLGGALLWLANCPAPHRTIPCGTGVCKVANWNHPPNCPYDTACSKGAACTAYPYNPVDGRCARDDATTITLAANATDGSNPLFPVSFRAVGSCAPGALLSSLPAGAAGVAGLSRLPLSLPWQAAYRLGVPKQFALCLPAGSGYDGVAIFGGGPFQLLAAPPVEIAERLRQNQLPLLRNPRRNNGAYYFRVTGIAVNQQKVTTAPGAFDLDRRHGTGGVVLSTVTPYTALRPDIYRPLHDAFNASTNGIARAPPVAPFDMCYQASALGETRMGFAVANIDLMLDVDGGRNWTVFGGSSLVQVSDQTVCFAFVPMVASMPAAADSPAVILGGFQIQNHLLMFDLEKGTFGFSGPLSGIRTGCGNFNFTMGST